MKIYIALRDSDQPQSFVIGAFSDEPKAQAACQEDADQIRLGWDLPAQQLTWKEAEAESYGGDRYAVVLVDLDTPVS